MMSNTIRRTALAALAVATVALTGCAYNYSGAQRLERWDAGETRDLMLVRGVHELDPSIYKSECNDNEVGKNHKGHAVDSSWLAFVRSNICPNMGQWKRFSGIIKSDFGKGIMLGNGVISPVLKVEVNDIIEVSRVLVSDGKHARPDLAVRIIRKNALKERDPTCYWDGQSGALDSFATGGVVCPAEGWDWRKQKWAKK